MRIVLASLALLLASCMSTEVMRLDPGPHPARAVDAVAFLDELPPTSTYLALARIEVTDGGWRQPPSKLRERLRRKAAELGAEAVVLEHPGARRTTGAAPYVIARYDERSLAGTAIVFRPAPPPEPPG